jgi:hypothetical protein
MKKTPLVRKTPLKAGKKKLLNVVKGHDPAIIDKLKAKGLVKTASSLAKPRKNTGEKEVFRLIWDSRKHACEVCGIGIHEARSGNFAHVLPKGAYPEFRLREDNIFLLCVSCHDRQHYYGNSLRTSYKWKLFWKRHDELMEEAYPEGR